MLLVNAWTRIALFGLCCCGFLLSSPLLSAYFHDLLRPYDLNSVDEPSVVVVALSKDVESFLLPLRYHLFDYLITHIPYEEEKHSTSMPAHTRDASRDREMVVHRSQSVPMYVPRYPTNDYGN